MKVYIEQISSYSDSYLPNFDVSKNGDGKDQFRCYLQDISQWDMLYDHLSGTIDITIEKPFDDGFVVTINE